VFFWCFDDFNNTRAKCAWTQFELFMFLGALSDAESMTKYRKFEEGSDHNCVPQLI
jgi:hypothetical protein